MSDEREHAASLLESSGRDFDRLVSGIEAPDWGRAPAGGGWSIAEIAEHVTLVETGTARLFRKRLFQAPADPELLRQTRDRDRHVREYQEDRQTRRVAPDFVTPRGTWATREDVVQAFLNARAAVIAAVRSAPPDLRAYAWPHPLLGPLDAYQWALFLALHLERHLAQIADRR